MQCALLGVRVRLVRAGNPRLVPPVGARLGAEPGLAMCQIEMVMEHLSGSARQDARAVCTSEQDEKFTKTRQLEARQGRWAEI